MREHRTAGIEREGTRQQDAIADLAGELEHLRAGGGDVKRALDAALEHHLRAAQTVDLAIGLHRLARPKRAQHLHVFAHHAHRLDRLGAGFCEVEHVADRHGQRGARPRVFGQRGHRHGHRQRRPQIGADGRRHQPDGRSHADRSRRPDDGLAKAHVLREPEAVGPRLLGRLRDFEHLAGRTEPVEVDPQRHRIPRPGCNL